MRWTAAVPSSRPSSDRIAGAIAAAARLLLAFAWHARRVAAPAVDLSLLRQRSFGIATLAGGLSRIGMNGVPYLLPLMLQ
ncbi:MAG TPA: hypothetical protein VF516_32185, partial [Kofleriaceae bacterium]